MLHIEKNLGTIDFESLMNGILETETETVNIKERYQFLESRLNAIMGLLAQKMNNLNQEKNAILTQS